MPKLPIVTGAATPVLRAKAKKIAKVTKEIRTLVKNMQETVKGIGAGLAAPQVGESIRLCLAMVGDKIVVMINPEITSRSAELVTDVEGCLSLPGQDVAVARAKEITVRYLDEKEAEQERRLTDWDARVVQHEVDHLDGVLIVDYLGPLAVTPKSSRSRETA